MMTLTNVLVQKQALARVAIKFLMLVSLASIIPALVHNQALTGPTVNALLFVGTVILGRELAMLIGILPSAAALLFGFLPLILAPAVPFIMASNALLVLTFGLLLKKNFWLGMISGSLLKFLFLFTASAAFANQKIAAILSWPQLFTALAGGIIAFSLLKTLKKI
jgi:hypothetical protein